MKRAALYAMVLALGTGAAAFAQRIVVSPTPEPQITVPLKPITSGLLMR